MRADMQLELWSEQRKNPNMLTGEEMPSPIASVAIENKRAEALVAQLRMLEEFGKEDAPDADEQRS